MERKRTTTQTKKQFPACMDTGSNENFILKISANLFCDIQLVKLKESR